MTRSGRSARRYAMPSRVAAPRSETRNTNSLSTSPASAEAMCRAPPTPSGSGGRTSRKSPITTGSAAITIHAPKVNRVATTITKTTPVVVAPITFSVAFRFQPGVRRATHRRTMPACERVSATNTPTT